MKKLLIIFNKNNGELFINALLDHNKYDQPEEINSFLILTSRVLENVKEKMLIHATTIEDFWMKADYLFNE